jgi:hypothetical protein
MIVREKKRFWMGMIGLIIFFIILSFWSSPVIDHKTGLEWADDLFNQLSKTSAYKIPIALKKATRFEGIIVDLDVNPKWPGAAEKVTKIITVHGLAAQVLDDGTVRIRGDLGLMSKAAIMDADLLFADRDQELQGKYGMSGREVIYCWWTGYDDLVRRSIQLNRPSEADFAKFMMIGVLEPSYNFVGIRRADISQNIGRVVFLLGFYVFYAVLYGFSMMYIFEGIGVTATKATRKKEA